jgi:hypothetical protein
MEFNTRLRNLALQGLSERGIRPNSSAHWSRLPRLQGESSTIFNLVIRRRKAPIGADALQEQTRFPSVSAICTPLNAKGPVTQLCGQGEQAEASHRRRVMLLLMTATEIGPRQKLSCSTMTHRMRPEWFHCFLSNFAIS